MFPQKYNKNKNYKSSLAFIDRTKVFQMKSSYQKYECIQQLNKIIFYFLYFKVTFNGQVTTNKNPF
jgi:hypothetical protein